MNFEEEESINILLNIFKSNFFKKVHMTLAFVGCVTTFICATPLSRLECISLVIKLNFLYDMKLNKLIIVSIFVLSIIIYGCTAKSENVDNIYHKIDIESAIFNDQKVKLSDYVSCLDYIPIETNENFLVSDIFKFSPFDDYIAICCNATQQVYQLSKDGKLLKKIGRRGNAKNEYRAVNKLVTTPETIIVFMGTKIISFSALTGDIKQVVVPNDINDVKIFGGFALCGKDSFAILHNMNEGENYISIVNDKSTEVQRIKLWDTKKRKVEVPMPTGGIMQLEWAYLSTLYNVKDSLRVTNDFIDTIYTYSDDKLLPHIVFNYGKLGNNRFEPKLNTELAFTCTKVKETKKLLLFENLDGDKFLYDKSNGETKRIKKFDGSTYQGFTNDIDNGIPFWPVAVTSDKMYSFMSADIFIEEAAKSNSEKMKQVAATINEESNPVIIVATLK